MRLFSLAGTLAAFMVFFSSAVAPAADIESIPEQLCRVILSRAYPDDPPFSSCESLVESHTATEVKYKIIINFRGSLLGTPYTLKGHATVTNSGITVNWVNKPTVNQPQPVFVPFEGSSKWDF
ncbi:MAG: hypothetical protein RBU45_18995 [Myxococcota bacterium]|jgi:hypothetical protein|nr:hypothetical protein [Myxococcota bacterium]